MRVGEILVSDTHISLEILRYSIIKVTTSRCKLLLVTTMNRVKGIEGEVVGMEGGVVERWETAHGVGGPGEVFEVPRVHGGMVPGKEANVGGFKGPVVKVDRLRGKGGVACGKGASGGGGVVACLLPKCKDDGDVVESSDDIVVDVGVEHAVVESVDELVDEVGIERAVVEGVDGLVVGLDGVGKDDDDALVAAAGSVDDGDVKWTNGSRFKEGAPQGSGINQCAVAGCSHRFRHQSSLIRHMSKAHSVQVVSEDRFPERKMVCPGMGCSLTFMSATKMVDYLEKNHHMDTPAAKLKVELNAEVY